MSEDSTVRFGIRRYVVPNDRPGEGWGIFIIDDAGFFAVVSDWGNYAFRWTAPGCDDFRDFLCDLDASYLCSKLAPKSVFDGERTEQLVVERILRLRRDRDITRTVAREEYDVVRRSGLDREADFVLWLQDTGLEDAWELSRCGPEPQAVQFCKRLYPRFVELLRAELSAEVTQMVEGETDA